MERKQLFDVIKTNFGVAPEFLWKPNDDAIFRNPENGKWFGIVMSVRTDRFIPQADGKTDVLNVKCDISLASSLVKKPYVFPAYHMAKGSWISILINMAPSDDEIISLLTLSRAITCGQKL